MSYETFALSCLLGTEMHRWNYESSPDESWRVCEVCGAMDTDDGWEIEDGDEYIVWRRVIPGLWGES
jgi:hypothetical protein